MNWYYPQKKEDSWDEAFTAHVFTSQQEQIMNNFNIRYECLDQRDDFFSELRKGVKGAIPGVLDGELIANLDEMNQTAVLDEMIWPPIILTLMINKVKDISTN